MPRKIDGRPDQSPRAFEPFLREIKRRSDVVVNLTSGGSPFMSVEERVRPAAVWKPEVASVNMGSMNFGLFPMLRRYKEFKHLCEPQMLENSRDLVFRNSLKDSGYALRTLNETDTRCEFECYDTSHLYNLHHFWQEGMVKAPLFIQTVFGLLGGIGAHPEDVQHMRRTADRLFGEHYRWSVLGAGRSQMQLVAMGAAMGGNVRVGLEDSLWGGKGRLAESNAQQVQQARASSKARPARSCHSKARTRSRSEAKACHAYPISVQSTWKVVVGRADAAQHGLWSVMPDTVPWIKRTMTVSSIDKSGKAAAIGSVVFMAICSDSPCSLRRMSALRR